MFASPTVALDSFVRRGVAGEGGRVDQSILEETDLNRDSLPTVPVLLRLCEAIFTPPTRDAA